MKNYIRLDRGLFDLQLALYNIKINSEAFELREKKQFTSYS
jgi:hypothetical protein